MSPRGTQKKTKAARMSPFATIYVATFLFALHIALPLYINSSFLSQHIPEQHVGYVYAAASVAAIAALVFYPIILRLIGNYRAMAGIVITEIVALLGLASLAEAGAIMLVFIASQVLITLGLFSMDVFLEAFSDDRITGTLRGMMLTMINVAILLGPITAGVIITDSTFERVYLLSAILLLPLLWLVASEFKRFKDPRYHRIPLFSTIKTIFRDRNLHNVFAANLLLRFFYSWMVIYTPIYLSRHIGFSWGEIGVILSIMLLPFVLFEIPIGRIADRLFGEKEIMAFGFFIMALFSAALPFVSTPSFILWAALLFGSRIGASFVEITSESYFFKHISSRDTNLLSVFRDTRPIAYLIGPFLASWLLFVMDVRYLFLVLAAIMLYGIYVSMRIRDTK